MHIASNSLPRKWTRCAGAGGGPSRSIGSNPPNSSSLSLLSADECFRFLDELEVGYGKLMSMLVGTDGGAITNSWPRGFHSMRPWSHDPPSMHTHREIMPQVTVENTVKNWNISEVLCLHLPSNITGAHSAFLKALLSSLSRPQSHQLQNLLSPNHTRCAEDIQAVRMAYRETAGSASVCPRLIGPLDVEETGFIPSTYCIFHGSSRLRPG